MRDETSLVGCGENTTWLTARQQSGEIALRFSNHGLQVGGRETMRFQVNREAVFHQVDIIADRTYQHVVFAAVSEELMVSLGNVD